MLENGTIENLELKCPNCDNESYFEGTGCKECGYDVIENDINNKYNFDPDTIEITDETSKKTSNILKEDYIELEKGFILQKYNIKKKSAKLKVKHYNNPLDVELKYSIKSSIMPSGDKNIYPKITEIKATPKINYEQKNDLKQKITAHILGTVKYNKYAGEES